METQKIFAQIKNSLKDIQWRWIFGATFAVMGTLQLVMFLIISIYVARSSAAGNTLSYEEITQFSGTLGAQVGPIIFGLLTLMASIWLAIKVRVAPRMHGLVLGLVLLTATVILDAIFSPSLELYEHLGNTIVIPIAWFGAYRGEIIIKNREAVYRTSQLLFIHNGGKNIN